jgi:Tfp pilus assembly protein PilF
MLNMLPGLVRRSPIKDAHFEGMDYKIMIKTLFSLAVLTLFGYFPSFSQPQPTSGANDSFALCMANLKANKFDAAVADCTNAIKKAPDRADTYQMRAFAYVYLKNNQAALDDITKAIQLSPNNVSMHGTRGLILMDMKRLDQALDDFNTMLRLTPDNLEALFHRAQVHAELGNRDLAIKDYKAFLAKRPDEKTKQVLAALEASPDKGERYSNTIFKYAFVAPDDSTKVPEVMGTRVEYRGDKGKFDLATFVLELKTDPETKEMSNLLATDAGVSSVANKLITQLKSDSANVGFTLLETKRVKAAGLNAVKISFSTSQDGKRIRKVLVVVPVPEQNRNYKFLVSAYEENFDKWFAKAEISITSFEVVRP